MENAYYAVDRSDEYLAHYGIKGMKWGVRKAIESGNARRLGRQFRKAEKKLAKLEKRAASGSKYARRAAGLGAGAALAGGAAALGTEGISNVIKGVGALGSKASNKHLRAARRAANAGGLTSAQQAAKAVSDWGASNSIGKSAGGIVSRYDTGYRRAAQRAANSGKQYGLSGLSNNTIARAGAAALGAGLAGAAGYNAYRAATTKRAAKKAAAFRAEMQKSFAGTKYANQIGQSRKKKNRRG